MDYTPISPIAALAFFTLCSSGYATELSDTPGKTSPQKQENRFLNNEPFHPNWLFFADFLYWHIGEVGTIPNSTIAVTANQGLTSRLDLNNLNFGWDLGFRVGGRYSNIGQNEWGVSFYYTWYRTEAKNSGTFPGYVGIPSGFPLTGTLSDVEFSDLSWLYAAKSYKAQWSLLYNVFDFETDHEYAAGRTLRFRPYLGLRGGWIDQNIDIHSIYLNDSNVSIPAKEKLQNLFWGIGPRCGLDSKWRLGTINRHSFYLFGDLSGSFLWSFWKMADALTINDIDHGDLKGKNRYAGSVMLQNLLGLEWSIALHRGALISLRCSYETQVWLDHLQVFNTYNGRQHNALTLQGATFNLRFNF